MSGGVLFVTWTVEKCITCTLRVAHIVVIVVHFAVEVHVQVDIGESMSEITNSILHPLCARGVPKRLLRAIFIGNAESVAGHDLGCIAYAIPIIVSMLSALEVGSQNTTSDESLSPIANTISYVFVTVSRLVSRNPGGNTLVMSPACSGTIGEFAGGCAGRSNAGR